MSLLKLAIAVIVLGVIGLFAYDGVQVLDAHRNIRDAAAAVASAAAHAIATSKDCTTNASGAPTSSTNAATTGAAAAGSNAAATTSASTSATATKGCDSARIVADKTAQSQGDVVTSFTYDPVAVRVSVTVSGSAKSLVLHYFDRGITDNIHAAASARPE